MVPKIFRRSVKEIRDATYIIGLQLGFAAPADFRPFTFTFPLFPLEFSNDLFSVGVRDKSVTW